MLLIYPGTALEIDSAKIRHRYASIFKAFGDRVSFVILANNVKIDDHAAEYEMSKQFEEALVSSHLFPQHHVIVIGTASPKDPEESQGCAHGFWAQDPFVVLRDEHGQTVLLEPMFHTHRENALLAEQLASSTNLLLRPTRYYIEGGNVLVGDDFAMVGMAVFQKNYEAYFSHLPLHRAKEELTGEFKRLLGVKYLIWVGFDMPRIMPLGLLQDPYNLQPLFHLDLFLTLGGKNPETGDEVLFVGAASPENTVYLGDAKADCAISIQAFNQAMAGLGRQLETFHEREAGPKFQVEHMPMGLEIDADFKAHVYSYNNAHVEWYHGIKRIYLPKYPAFATAIHPMEEKARRLLTGLKYKVDFIENSFERYSKYGHGSLHCLSKVLARSSY